ncbi:MAG TPA: hypothetical protein P5171_04100 [Xanthomonadaceae bacterium]|nr:hypothetical protein [Xanthomonadaceae bacterium]
MLAAEKRTLTPFFIGEQLYVAGFFAGTGLAESSKAASGLARFQLGSVPGPDQVFASGFE